MFLAQEHVIIFTDLWGEKMLNRLRICPGKSVIPLLLEVPKNANIIIIHNWCSDAIYKC